ncbi:class I SAM-dependent methyltransferase [Catenovulum maritimum]|uniref:Methyltransferase type 11 domain-containing protein n=1 Tax=Catenovulum maritimum TaxID=1513271 RepID=A0A0J8H0D9_9ALTE|nr:class I SAM-dependent methyltransferase [Catenovulum maritimum]KMT66483.1 hypothetical protein XM47_02780 [Catenovulum maritimum]
MKPALQDLLLELPSCWSDLPSGLFVQKQIERHLNPWLPKVFGYHFLKLGRLSTAINTTNCSIKHQVNVGNEGHNLGVLADIHHLPFSENSVDGILLAQSLDFTSDPHQVLREAHRVLIPDGYIFITGFNPISLTGICRYLPGMKKNLLNNARFFSVNRIGDWLNLLGCEVIDDSRFILSPLTGGSNKYKPKFLRQSWFSSLSYKYFNRLGSVYLIVARKRELPLTPIKPKWKVKPKLQTVTNVRIKAGVD